MTTKTDSLVERARLGRDGIGRAIYGETWPGPGGGDDSEMHIGHNVAEAATTAALWAVVDEVREEAVTLPNRVRRILEALANGIEERLLTDGIERPHA